MTWTLRLFSVAMMAALPALAQTAPDRGAGGGRAVAVESLPAPKPPPDIGDLDKIPGLDGLGLGGGRIDFNSLGGNATGSGEGELPALPRNPALDARTWNLRPVILHHKQTRGPAEQRQLDRKFFGLDLERTFCTGSGCPGKRKRKSR